MDRSSTFNPDMKVEMKALSLSETSRNKVRETIEYLRGIKFSKKDQSAYKEKKVKLDKQYWIDRGNLEVRGCVSNQGNPKLTPNEKIQQFALNKLLRYGFHRVHCVEALQASSGDVGQAYEILMSRYFSVPLPTPKPVSDELINERTSELESLLSIYGDCCKERIANQLWVVDLELPYLTSFVPGARSSSNNNNKKKVQVNEKNVCRFFLRGHCKFPSNKCRFLHPPPEQQKPTNMGFVDPDRGKFQLEIRFPQGCQYPLESPLVSFLALSEGFPFHISLRITHTLLKEADIAAKREQPSIYELMSLLINRHEEVEEIAKMQPHIFYSPLMPLFPKAAESDVEDEDQDLAEGISDSDLRGHNTKQYNGHLEQTIREDNELCKKFQEKQNNISYQKMLKRRHQLPAWNKQKEILELIVSHQVVVISGDTGCGKSTQVPQFILDDWMTSRVPTHVEVICTQPRRISAIGVAERVASERAERVGGSVGYQIRLENKVSSITRLTFCTMGILLRRLESDFTLSGVSHVIVDEVHERSEESDFLLLILKDVLRVRSDLKLILMSATLNPEVFCDYFGGVPILEIPGRTFPVEQIFLEDIVARTDYIMEEYSEFARKISKNKSLELESMDEFVVADQQCSMDSVPNPKCSDEVLSVKQIFHRYKDYPHNVKKFIFLNDVERINFDLIEHILSWIVGGTHDYPREGSILIFLPGIGEIRALYDLLIGNVYFAPSSGKFEIIPLHSSLTNEEQSLVFRKSKVGTRKIILATNIAETSITIDDCVFVIDTGKKKEKMFDNNKNMESLECVWVARANAIQRKGRAGRVMPGVAIHLFSRHRFGYLFREQPVPEIHRAPLEQIILKIKLLSSLANKDIYEVLGATIEPPQSENITAAIVRLRNVGALNPDNSLTALGQHLASLPVDVRIGKFILMGTILCCLDSTLTIAASLSYKSPFISPFNKKEEADKRKKEFVTSHSDHLTVLKAYNSWKKACENGRNAGMRYANNHFLSSRTLTSLTEIKFHLLELLMDIGFVHSKIALPKNKSGYDKILDISGSELNVNGENKNLLAAVMCAALYPNIVKVLTPEKQYTQSIAGAIPVESNPQDIKFKTKEDGYVHIHPSSVNYNIGSFPYPYLVFQEKVKTSKIFIRDCTVVPVLPLVIFSSAELKVELLSGTFVVSMDDRWIMFTVPDNEVAELIETIKKEFLSLLDEKIKKPTMNLQASPKSKKIISTIVYMVTNG